MLRILMLKVMVMLGMAGFAMMVDFQQSQKRNPDLTLENYIEVRLALVRLLIAAQSAEAEMRKAPTSEVTQAGSPPTSGAADQQTTPAPDEAATEGSSLLQKPQFGSFGTCRIEGGRKTCSISDG